VALKEEAADEEAPTARSGAESAAGNEVLTGALAEGEARAAGPGATSAVGQEKPAFRGSWRRCCFQVHQGSLRVTWLCRSAGG